MTGTLATAGLKAYRNIRTDRQQEYHGLIIRQARNSTSHSSEANNSRKATNSMDDSKSRNIQQQHGLQKQ
jgi:hypothetical protein